MSRTHPLLAALLLLGALLPAAAAPQRRPALAITSAAAPKPLSDREIPAPHRAPARTRLLAAAGAPGCSVTTTVVQIVNNVAGAGILTLAAGMAAGVGWGPAILMCAAPQPKRLNAD